MWTSNAGIELGYLCVSQAPVANPTEQAHVSEYKPQLLQLYLVPQMANEFRDHGIERRLALSASCLRNPVFRLSGQYCVAIPLGRSRSKSIAELLRTGPLEKPLQKNTLFFRLLWPVMRATHRLTH